MATYKRIVIATMSRFNPRDAERFGLHTFRSYGFDVEIWDLSKLIFPHVAKNLQHHGMVCKVYEFGSWSELEKHMSRIDQDSCFIISLCNLHPRTKRFFRLKSKYRLPYLLSSCNMPISNSYTDKRSIWQKFSDLLKHPHQLQEFLQLRSLLRFYKWFGISGPKYLLCGGKSSDNHSKFFAEAQRIWAHSYDYDNALKLNTIDFRAEKSPYAVFLDHGTPYHPDNFITGKEIPEKSRPERYYPSILWALNLVEQKLNLPVIIAAHPRWEFEKYANPYEGRKIIGGQTAALVKDATLVIAHNSTSLTYACIFRKPVFFIHSSAHNPQIIQSTAEAFGKRAYAFHDRDHVDVSQELDVNQSLYEKIEEKYIKSPGTPRNKLSWEIVAGMLQR